MMRTGPCNQLNHGGPHVLELDTDVEEYRFADRHLAAQAWAIAAELVARHPDLRISHVVDEKGAPLLIVHDEPQLLHIQFDLVAWILYVKADGEHATLFWDQVFAYDTPATVVDLLEDHTAIGRGTPDLGAPRALTYAAIAAAVRAGVDREDGCQATGAGSPFNRARRRPSRRWSGRRGQARDRLSDPRAIVLLERRRAKEPVQLWRSP